MIRDVSETKKSFLNTNNKFEIISRVINTSKYLFTEVSNRKQRM